MNTVFLPVLLLAIATVSQSLGVGSRCGEIPIEVWGVEPLNRTIPLPKPVKIVVIQHTETVPCTTDVSCENLVRNIRRNHKSRGMSDIAQSFLVGSNGKIYEGAGWMQGSHTASVNDRSISISYMGNFKDELPNAQALQAVRDFLSCSVNNRNLDRNYNLAGHKQFSDTTSPGVALQCLIQTWPHWLRDVSNL